MIKLSLYKGDKTYMFPSGNLATPEAVYAKYPAVKTFKHVIGTDESGEVLLSITNLSLMRSRYNIDASLSDDDAIRALEDATNTQKKEEVVNNAPSATERIAAALEYQNLLAMEDVL